MTLVSNNFDKIISPKYVSAESNFVLITALEVPKRKMLKMAEKAKTFAQICEGG